MIGLKPCCRMAGCKSMAGTLEEQCQWLMQAAKQADTLYTECHCLWGSSHALRCRACRMAGCESVASSLEERRQWLIQAAEQADRDQKHAEAQVHAAQNALKSENDIRVGSREVCCCHHTVMATLLHSSYCSLLAIIPCSASQGEAQGEVHCCCHTVRRSFLSSFMLSTSCPYLIPLRVTKSVGVQHPMLF